MILPETLGIAAPRTAPLLITAELPSDVFAWADGFRRCHYPPERNRLGAHVTLFHGLPFSAHNEVCCALEGVVQSRPPEAQTNGLLKLDRGTAIEIESQGLLEIHAQIFNVLKNVIRQKDARPLQLHITIQDKVPPEVARALQASLADRVPVLRFYLEGLVLSQWHENLWHPLQRYPFSGHG